MSKLQSPPSDGGEGRGEEVQLDWLPSVRSPLFSLGEKTKRLMLHSGFTTGSASARCTPRAPTRRLVLGRSNGSHTESQAQFTGLFPYSYSCARCSNSLPSDLSTKALLAKEGLVCCSADCQSAFAGNTGISPVCRMAFHPVLSIPRTWISIPSRSGSRKFFRVFRVFRGCTSAPFFREPSKHTPKHSPNTVNTVKIKKTRPQSKPTAAARPSRRQPLQHSPGNHYEPFRSKTPLFTLLLPYFHPAVGRLRANAMRCSANVRNLRNVTEFLTFPTSKSFKNARFLIKFQKRLSDHFLRGFCAFSRPLHLSFSSLLLVLSPCSSTTRDEEQSTETYGNSW